MRYLGLMTQKLIKTIQLIKKSNDANRLIQHKKIQGMYVMKLNEAFALRVKEILKENKMTQYKLAQATGLYHSTMTDILNCKYETPNFRNMALIIRELGMTMTEFFNSPLFDFEKLEIKEK